MTATSVSSVDAPAAVRRGMIAAMIATYAIFAVLLNSVGTLILQSQVALGAGKAAVSVLDAYKDLPIAIVSFLVAAWLPRFGYRRAMIAGLALVAIACLAMRAADAFWMVKLMLAATGVAFALVKVSVYATIGLLTDDRRRHASLTSTIEGWFMVGVLAGPWLFGLFIRRQQAPTDPVWLDLYLWLAAACVLTIVLLATVRLDESRARATPSGDVPAGSAFADMLRLTLQPLVAVFVLSAFLYVLIEQSIGTWLPTFNADLLHLSTATSVQLASVFAACTALGRLLAGFALRHVSWQWLLLGCLGAAAGIVLLALPLADGVVPPLADGWRHAPAAAFALPLIGLFLAPIYPTINSVVLSALPKHRHAAMTGLIVVFSALGGTTGSFLTGQLFARVGGQTAFYLTLVPLALLAVAVRGLHRRVDAASLADSRMA
jgi:fucose permease